HDSHLVSDAPSDLVSRGQAIFERLRAEPQGPVETSAPEPGPEVQTPDEAVVVAPEAPEVPEVLVEAVSAPAEAGTSAATEPAPAAIEATAPVVEPDPARFIRPLPRVMAITNQKGGVGKTTTAVNLGAAVADLGYRVLVVDLDPQGNATTGLGLNTRDLQSSMYDVILHDASIDDCIEATSVRNLFVAPASLDLAGAEIELVPAFSRELKLRKALEEVASDYDYVFIDCPPSLGLLTVNSLAAATEVIVPIQCEYYALEGLGQLLRNVNLVQKNLNQALEVSAIVCVMYDARTKLSDQVVQEVRAHFGEKVCRTVVPRTVRLSEAPSYGQPITAFDPSSRGAIAYRELAKEITGGTPQRTG
ncbi:MAG: chromosome partitioning protein, partial [Acidimicrobiaceae bacterium]